jgi:2-polyprenyl-3-methyl-5-hydroxy-6-metoxy-1,4-benzoquinol methylase
MKRFIAPCLTKSSRVLDAAQNCLVDSADVRELIGVDRDHRAIKENRSITRGVVADLETLAEIDLGETVNFVMCVDVTEHLSDPVRFVGNCQDTETGRTLLHCRSKQDQ